MMSRAVVGLQNLLGPASENPPNAVIVSRQVLQAEETQYQKKYTLQMEARFCIKMFKTMQHIMYDDGNDDDVVDDDDVDAPNDGDGDDGDDDDEEEEEEEDDGWMRMRMRMEMWMEDEDEDDDEDEDEDVVVVDDDDDDDDDTDDEEEEEEEEDNYDHLEAGKCPMMILQS